MDLYCSVSISETCGIKMKPPTIENMRLVPEDIIKWCASQLDGEENNFELCLDVAKELRDAGLTPVYLCSESLKDLFVTTKEKLQKKLH